MVSQNCICALNTSDNKGNNYFIKIRMIRNREAMVKGSKVAIQCNAPLLKF